MRPGVGAIVSVVVASVCVLNLAGVKMVFAIQSEESVMRGLKLMKISQVVYFVLFVMLVAVCILLNLADGALKDIHSEFRDRWFAPALPQKNSTHTSWNRLATYVFG